MTRAAVIALSHGGGPLPLLGDPGHTEIVKSLRTRVPKLLRLGTPDSPKAIVLVTAHWSENVPTISNAAKHGMLYDYYGFPRQAYEIKYNASGEPEVAQEVYEAFKSAGLNPKTNSKRGWDHGVFVPMLLINPREDVPIVQVSVLSSEDVSKHFAMGRALQKLRDSNIAIIGSGFASFHNLNLMFKVANDEKLKTRNEEWSKAVTRATLERDSHARERNFSDWRNWPGGQEMHPPGGGEHFMPLIVCAGAGGDKEAEFYTDKFMGLDMYSYYWK